MSWPTFVGGGGIPRVGRVGIPPGRTVDWKETTGNLERRVDSVARRVHPSETRRSARRGGKSARELSESLSRTLVCLIICSWRFTEFTRAIPSQKLISAIKIRVTGQSGMQEEVFEPLVEENIVESWPGNAAYTSIGMVMGTEYMWY